MAVFVILMLSMNIAKEMTSKDVIDFYTKAESLGLRLWIDGGWAVDALLGEQTRPHKDLDIAINNDDFLKLLKMLDADGYKEARKDGEWNYVLVDDKGHEIDVHVFITDANGNVIDGIKYPTESLTGIGVIDGHSVRCISPKYMVQFMVPWAYKHKDEYTKDLKSLCDKFGIDYPTVLKDLL